MLYVLLDRLNFCKLTLCTVDTLTAQYELAVDLAKAVQRECASDFDRVSDMLLNGLYKC